MPMALAAMRTVVERMPEVDSLGGSRVWDTSFGVRLMGMMSCEGLWLGLLFFSAFSKGGGVFGRSFLALFSFLSRDIFLWGFKLGGI